MSGRPQTRVGLIGHGAIGRAVAAGLLGGGGADLAGVLVRKDSPAAAEGSVGAAPVVTSLDELLALGPNLVVECAGQPAVHAHAAAVLARGVDLMVISTGALATTGLLDGLLAAARDGARLVVPAGAIAGLDGLGALKQAGLESVLYTSTKPPAAWKGTPAEEACDLDAVSDATVVFDGSAREAALRFPKNANLAATVALAGLGLDRTRVRLVADPAATGNTGRIDAQGEAGSLAVTMAGPASANPKTSASVAFSVLHAIRMREATLVI